MPAALDKAGEQRLKDGVLAVLSLPFVDDIEDFIWEAVFAYARQIPLQDTLSSIRSKRLFDLIDPVTRTGWSAKALQCSGSRFSVFELVIQRADIFKKAKLLGFKPLSLRSDPAELGEALLKHWSLKLTNDATLQEVKDFRVCVLLKSRDRTRYALYEGSLAIYKPEDLHWRWTNDTQTGLQAYREGKCVYRWYPNQKQFFERFVLPDDAYQFTLAPRRLPVDEVIQHLLELLK